MDHEVRVRRLGRGDAAAFRDLRLLALRESPEAFASSVEEERDRPLAEVAERLDGGLARTVIGALDASGALVGTAGLLRERPRKMAHRAHLWGMFVHPDHRGRGVGRAVMDAALAHARRLRGVVQVHLGVAVSNAPALALYRAAGFEVYGTEPRALRVDGRFIDEALMVRFLDR